MDDQERQG